MRIPVRLAALTATVALFAAVQSPGSALAATPSPQQAGGSASSTPTIATRHVPSIPRGTKPASHFQRASAGAPVLQRIAPSPATAVTPGISASPAPPVPAQRGSLSTAGGPPGSAPSLLQSFPGTSQSQALQSIGNDQRLMPPDPTLAVGPTNVVEITNDALYVFSRTGATLAQFDLYGLTGATTTNWAETDPRVVYDAASGRFYLSVLGYNPTSCASQVYLLRTDSTDPTGGWHGFVLFNQQTGSTADQPALGFSNNVVALTWNYFSCTNGVVSNWMASQLDVVQKSDLLSLGTTANTADAFINGPPSPLPVVSLGSTAAQYVTYNGSSTGTGYIGTFAITGTPEQRNVTSAAEVDEPINATQAPGGAIVSAAQKGTSMLLQTGDDRLLNGVWQKGTIWAAGNTQCTPSGDASRSCLNIVSIPADAGGNVGAATQVFPFPSVAGSYLYYPAISVDATGNAFVAYDQSSAITFESIQVAGVSGGSMSASTTVHTSTTFYNPGTCTTSGATGGCRWGDYSGAAQDPSHPSDVWIASETADGSTSSQCNNTAPYCWNSYVARVTYASPSVVNVTPAAGPTGGGQAVTINGSDFGTASAVTLGGTPATITSLTPDSVHVTTPAHAAGLVQAQVCDPACSSTTPLAPASAGYVYVPPSRFHPLPPTRVVDTRIPYCNECTTGYLRPGEVRGFTVSGVQGVPSTATSVVLNVTSCGSGNSGCVGSTSTYMTVFPTGTAQPGTSNINTPAGRDIANLVTVALGQQMGFSVYNDSGNHDLVVDVDGYYDAAAGNDGLFHPLAAPERACDTRKGYPGTCNTSGAGDPLGPGESRLITVALGGAGIPTTNAEAAVLNVTASGGTTSTYLTFYPPQGPQTCGSPPVGSNLNVPANTDEPNRAIVPINQSSGTICVFNAGGTVNVIVDANGWYGTAADTGGAKFQAIGPTRVCDTRAWDGTACAGHSIASWTTLKVLVAGVGGLPASGMVAVLANATAVSPSAPTYVTVFPDGQPYPNTSDLNAPANVNIANLVIVGVPGDGQVDVTNVNGTVDFLLDASGWFQ